MKFAKRWLDELVPNALSAGELAERLTMAGLEVDAIEEPAPAWSGVVVGEIISCSPLESAGQLQLVMVEAGRPEPLAVVCGAANCRPGLKVACALAGAELPGGRVIAPIPVQGTLSMGMLCSPRELGLSDEQGGVLELDDDARPGTDLRSCLQLEDRIIDVDLTANRPDCLSLRGLARECAVLLGQAVHEPRWAAVPSALEERMAVQVRAPEACPRYLTRIIRNVDQQARTPLWMAERLRRCGVRPVSIIVDVTNYVMLELGQPLHAFDLQRLNADLEVRWARSGEHLTVLSGADLTLSEDTLLIADARGPLALAGIFGGLGSGITAGTRHVLLEAAFFAPDAIRGRARAYGLHTDASHRFERGVDSEIQALALERATQLLLQHAGGQAGPVSGVVSAEHLPVRPVITLRLSQIETVLGIAIAEEECVAILQRLGLQPQRCAAGQLQVQVPSFRFDLEIEEDVIAELARIHGYEHIPPRCPVAELRVMPDAETRVGIAELREVLVQRSYQEAITYSFTDPQVLRALHAPRPLLLDTPLSPALSAMRTTLVAGLIGALRYNLNRQQRRVRLFECGLRYVPDEQAPQGVRQEAMICAIAAGGEEDWWQARRSLDFYDLKGDAEALLARYARPRDYSFAPTACAFLHPGQGADLFVAEQGPAGGPRRQAGVVGMLHPQVLRELELRGPVGVLELQVQALGLRPVPACADIPRFPSLRRDLCLLAAADIPVALMAEEIRAQAGALLASLRVIDVFAGADPGGRRSVTFSLVLQERTATLEDEQAERICAQIIAALADRFRAELRS